MQVKIDLNINPKTYWPQAKHIIKYAFSIVGEEEKGEDMPDRHFFEYHDAYNIPCRRALSSIAFYEELNQNCSRHFLAMAVQAALNCLKVKVGEDGAMTMQPGEAEQILKILQARLKLPKQTDLMYKLCSAVFFDQYETPEMFEYKYADEKVQLWKQLPDTSLFFSLLPIRKLIPYLNEAEKNIVAYEMMMNGQTNLMTDQHTSSIQGFLSKEQLKELSSFSD